MFPVSAAKRDLMSLLTFLEMSPIGADFSWIVLAKLLTPESSRKIRSLPVETTASRDTHPTLEIVSARVMLAGLSAPSYITIEFLPNITRKPL